MLKAQSICILDSGVRDVGARSSPAPLLLDAEFHAHVKKRVCFGEAVDYETARLHTLHLEVEPLGLSAAVSVFLDDQVKQATICRDLKRLEVAAFELAEEGIGQFAQPTKVFYSHAMALLVGLLSLDYELADHEVVGELPVGTDELLGFGQHDLDVDLFGLLLDRVDLFGLALNHESIHNRLYLFPPRITLYVPDLLQDGLPQLVSVAAAVFDQPVLNVFQELWGRLEVPYQRRDRRC
jgi:hypothetical protein